MKEVSTDTKTTTKSEISKAKTVEWILDRLVSGELISGENVPQENIDAFRSWFADSSNVDIKTEGIRQSIDKGPLNTLIMSYFFNAKNLTDKKRKEIASWLAEDIYIRK